MAYIDDHPNPNCPQQTKPRRAKVSGVIAVHTAESMLDVTGQDTGAEGVARYISIRDSYGSYHRLADSDSRINVVEFWAEAYHVAVAKMNHHAIGLSFACRTTDWAKMSMERRRGFLMNGARDAIEAMDYVKTTSDITVPLRWLTKDQAVSRVPGFVRHGTVDPLRRTDPGSMEPGPTQFPHTEYFQYILDLSRGSGPAPTPPQGEDIMTPEQERRIMQEFADVKRGVVLNAAALAKLNGIAEADYKAQLIDIHEAREQAAAAGKAYAEFEAELAKLS
jgi:hypothetical protein